MKRILIASLLALALLPALLLPCAGAAGLTTGKIGRAHV